MTAHCHQRRMLSLCTIAWLFHTIAVGQTTVSVTPAMSSVWIGEMDTVSVYVTGVSNLYGAHVTFSFDNTVMQSLAIDSGSFLGGPSLFMANPPPSPAVNSITVDQVRLGGTGVTGSGVLFKIAYSAVGVGSSPIILTSVDLRDSYNHHIPATTNSGTVVVTEHMVTVQCPVSTSWNLVSLPVTVGNAATSSLFPAAISSAFLFNQGAGYVACDTLQNCVGYWLKFPSAQTVSLVGGVRDLDTLQINAGWNLIGSISNAVPVTSLQTIPAGIISSSFYSYNGAYTVADTLRPSQGYWVKASQTGLLVIH